MSDPVDADVGSPRPIAHEAQVLTIEGHGEMDGKWIRKPPAPEPVAVSDIEAAWETWAGRAAFGTPVIRLAFREAFMAGAEWGLAQKEDGHADTTA